MSFATLITEKWPFFALAAVASAVTFLVQRKTAVVTLDLIPLDQRFGNAVISYVRYLGNMFWPANLAVFYPFHHHWPAWQITGAALVLLAITALALKAVRQRPYLLVGWLWFLGTLVPVIGVVQVGRQAMADRYTYVPLVGIFVMVAWGLAELAVRWKVPRTGIAVALAVVLVACLARTRMEVSFWQDSVSLFSRAVAVTKENDMAYQSLGYALFLRRDIDAAIRNYRESLRINPRNADACNNLGAALAEQGKFTDAIEQYREAMRLRPTSPEAFNNFGVALAHLKRFDEAAAQYQAALRLQPSYPLARRNMANTLIHLGRLPEAVASLNEYLREFPRDATAWTFRGQALARQGKTAEAIAGFKEAVRLQPDDPNALHDLGIMLFTQRNHAEAAEVFQRALRLQPQDGQTHEKLGTSLTVLGRYNEAVSHFAEAARLEPANVEAHLGWGRALGLQAKFAEAVPHFEEAARLKPLDDQIRFLLATACANCGRAKDAIGHFHETLRLKPDHPPALNTLARLLATHPDAGLRSGTEAVRLAERACVLTGNQSPATLDTLATSYAEAGRFTDAVAAQEKALSLAKTAVPAEEVKAMQARLELYKAGQPFHERR